MISDSHHVLRAAQHDILILLRVFHSARTPTTVRINVDGNAPIDRTKYPERAPTRRRSPVQRASQQNPERTMQTSRSLRAPSPDRRGDRDPGAPASGRVERRWRHRHTAWRRLPALLHTGPGANWEGSDQARCVAPVGTPDALRGPHGLGSRRPDGRHCPPEDRQDRSIVWNGGCAPASSGRAFL